MGRCGPRQPLTSPERLAGVTHVAFDGVSFSSLPKFFLPAKRVPDHVSFHHHLFPLFLIVSKQKVMALKVYADRLSQPSRAVIIFCKVNGIEFEEVRLDIIKKDHKCKEVKDINPNGQLPVIAHGTFTLFESHAILRYLAGAFPGVPDHWYPEDLMKRSKINAILDWHHTNLRAGAAPLNRIIVVAPALGKRLDEQAAKEKEEIMSSSLSVIESVWLKDDAKFLLGYSQPSIADLSLVCEITQLQLFDEKDTQRILGPHKKILQWMDNVKKATSPHFEEVHDFLNKEKARFDGMKAGSSA